MNRTADASFLTIVVTTAARNSINNDLLQRTLVSLRCACSPYKIHIFPTHPNSLLLLDDKRCDVQLVEAKRTLNLFQNTIRALNYGAMRSQWTLLVQDDVVFCRSFLPVADHVAERSPADAGCISFFTPHDQKILYDMTQIRIGDLLLYPADYFWGCQCVLFRQSFLLDYLTSEIVFRHKEIFPDPSKHVDLSIKLFLLNRPDYCLYSFTPCLAQHVGGNHSTVENQGDRASPNFPGESYNASIHLNSAFV